MRATPNRIRLSYCMIDGYMLVILPSETRRFRDAIAPIAVPLDLGPKSRSAAYRITEEQWPQFLAAVAELYPQWEPRCSLPAPPWAKRAMEELRRTTARDTPLRALDAPAADNLPSPGITETP